MAKRGTKAYKQEYVHVVYGINRQTKKVQSVWVRRDNVLSSMNPDGTSVTHPIKPGWTAEREAALVFGLTDTFSVPAGLTDGEFSKRRLEELRAKAEAMGSTESSD